MAKNSRAKGASGERELANTLKGYGYTARRGQQYCGANGDADVVGLDGIHIECKRVERLNIDTAMEQAIEDARGGELPAVFHRKNRKPWLVTMTLDDWMALYKAYKGVKIVDYYVVYIYATDKKDVCIGGSFIKLKDRIQTIDDINLISKDIEETNNYTNVVILNWKRL